MEDTKKKLSSQLLFQKCKDLTNSNDLLDQSNLLKQPQFDTSPLAKLRRSTPQISPFVGKMLSCDFRGSQSPFERRCFESPKIVKADFSIDLTDYFSNSQCAPFKFQTQEESQEQDYIVLNKCKRKIAANLLLDKPHNNASFILNGCQYPSEVKRRKLFIMKFPLVV